MLVATAGHIDHGKSTLVRALTGVETDRLPEERARGISIDLGFAYWRPDAGPTIGFVDVPGHERFLRNMIAGLSGIDCALLVVAADDGIMPQTVEHVQILSLLGIRRGFVAITKAGKADRARKDALRREVAGLLAPTTLAGAPLFEVDPLDGSGMAELAAALMAAREAGSGADNRTFRLAIDRAFVVPGAGTVVTGTVLAGSARVGDSLTVAPAGRAVRVRGLQSAGRKLEAIGPGERCAFNLAGIEVSEVHRGDWLVAVQGAAATTARIEADLRLVPRRDKPLRHDSRVHLHLGAACIGARVLTSRQRAVPPGETVPVSLALDAPTCALIGDRFVLRDASTGALLGGGVVLDPLPSGRRRHAEREARAAALRLPDAASRLAALAGAAGSEPDLGWFAAASGLDFAAAERMADAGSFIRSGKAGAIVIAAGRQAALEQAVRSALARHHADHPEASGPDRRTVRAGMSEPVSADLFASLIRSLAAAGRIAVQGPLLRLPDHAPRFSAVETQFWRNVLAMAEGQPPRAITAAELARELRTGEPAVTAMLQRRKASGEVWQVTGGKFMLHGHVAALAELADALDRASDNGFTAAAFRDASGIGRNFVIQLLEFFDRIGLTRRHGEARRMRADWQAVAGTMAEPVRP